MKSRKGKCICVNTTLAAPKQSPQAPVVATHIQVPDSEALGVGEGGRQRHRSESCGEGPQRHPPQQPSQFARDSIFKTMNL